VSEDETEVAELHTDAEVRAAFAVMGKLRTHLHEARFVEMVSEMRGDGYRLFALRQAGEDVALAGVRTGINLYYGRYMWVFELVTATGERSRGHGQRLLQHVEAVASAEGCDTIALSSGLKRVDAHRFYETRMGYERVSYVFKKSLG
jgi:GNAT superfamily N-acetyltransferase